MGCALVANQIHGCRYFRRLQQRYHPDLGLPPHDPRLAEEASPRAEEGEGGLEADETVGVPVYCVNLLRCNMQVGCKSPRG